MRVAPFTGAWIEMEVLPAGNLFGKVAPFTGAWIEIRYSDDPPAANPGRTLHGCVD